MKKFFKYVKLLRYGLQFRTTAIMSLFFVGLGVLFEMTMSFSTLFGMSLSGLYMGLIGAYSYQLCATAAVAKLVNASPMKRDLLTKAPVLIALITSLITYTIFILMRVFYTIGVRLPAEAAYYPDAEPMVHMSMIYCGVLIFVLMVYLPVSYKNYVLGIVILGGYLVFMLIFGNGETLTAFMIDKYNALIGAFGYKTTLALLTAFGYVCILIGAALGYLINLLTIRKEISPMIYRYALKQAAAK
ncbi:MAG: hypothetical protein IK001_03045 [Lachnospiraceae bacterium]|nr:hypothetical protein [Lachnospiraceae bacterium]